MNPKILFIGLALGNLLPAWSQKEKPLYKTVAEQWASIPSGMLEVTKKEVKPGKTRDFKMMQDSFAIKNFWMSKTEITNSEYLTFVNAVQKSGDVATLKAVLPDTLVWRYKLSYNEPYVEYYFRHPAYKYYPVVGITHEAALLYCKWLTEIYNARLKELFPNLNAKRVEVKLPSVNEWMWAAKGGHRLSPYPWGTPYLRNESIKSIFRGDFLCNFNRIGEGAISYNATTNTYEVKPYYEDYISNPGTQKDNADITAPVKSYWSNDYGLYNMSGNVAELTAEIGTAKGGSWYTPGYDAQIEAPDPFQGDTNPKPFVGFRPILVVVE